MSNNRAIVIGVSAGGFNALDTIFTKLKSEMSWPILVVQHLGENSGEYLCQYLNDRAAINIIQAEDKMPIATGYAYIAPSGYHLLLEKEMSLALSVDPPVYYTRPSIDVLFTSAARACGKNVIAVILTGANSDGTDGIKIIKHHQGIVIAQDPCEAESPIMPTSAIRTGQVDHILSLNGIAEYLNENC